MKYKKISKFINPQAKILLFIITIGFLLICSLSFIAINALKYEYDTNFARYIQEVKILKNLQDYYLLETDKKPSKQLINQTLFNQDKKVFFSLSHNFYQKLFLKKSHLLLQNLHQKEQKILDALQLYTPELEELLENYKANLLPQKELPKLQTKIKQVKKLISQLIDLRLEIATTQSNTIDSIYILTCIVLFSFMLIVLLTTIFLSNNILHSIKNHEQELQKTIKEKTLQLETINSNLQKTIQKEVESSRKKDRIMYQQDRLASMGEMIQNIAHQWRQPLNSLIILIQSFKTKFYNNKLDENFINTQTEDGLKIAKSMSETIENFRHFFQPNKSKNIFSITEGILDSIKLIEFVLKQNNIQIYTDIKEDCEIYGYKNAFTQVILNILKNSQDAIIERKITQGFCLISLEKKYDRIIITLKDNAGGVKQKSLYKIFEPYFTTKHKSVGTGIGLYMTKEIVEKQMHGKINIKNAYWNLDNQKYYGAMFIIEIPYLKNKNIGE